MTREGVVTERWVRYRHKENPEIEYDVECYTITGGGPVSYEFHGEQCFRIRTIRNLARFEAVHQPAYTMMPTERFFDVYERVEGVAA